MNILDTLKSGIRLESLRDGEALAEALSSLIPENICLALHGDLGVGKTTFVQHLAQAWGIDTPVTSPTFNIFTVYKGDRTLLHIDAYRLESSSSLDDLMLEEFLEEPYCIALEWPSRIDLDALSVEEVWHLDFEIRDHTHWVSLR